MTMHTLRGLGWDWRENGVVLKVKVQAAGGRIVSQEVFVPLNRVWHEFAGEFAAVGCPLPMMVGEPLTVGGFFKSLGSALKSVAKGVAKYTGTTAITKAAVKVSKIAVNYAQKAVTALAKIPIIGPLANAMGSLILLPASTMNALASGGRIDKVALGSLKSALSSVKAIAPYAQTVLSFVPGVGQGLSGAIGAAMALASGQSITQALMAGVKGALPGGPIAQAAFSIAADAMAGKPITTIAINAIPGLSAQAKNALMTGLDAAKRLAKGEKVAQVLVDSALHSLPPNIAKAVQIGASIAQAKSMQEAGLAAAGAATSLVGNLAKGTAAAAAIRALPSGLQPPAHLVQAVQKATAASNTLATVAAHAAAGNSAAKSIQTAAAILKKNPLQLLHIGMPAQVVPIYIGAPLEHHRRAVHQRVRGGRHHWAQAQAC